MTKEIKKYARKCDVTGKGMNDGWIWCEGSFYTSTLEITHEECRKDKEEILERYINNDFEPINDVFNTVEEYEVMQKKVTNKEALTDKELLEIAYMMDYCFYTVWGEDEQDYEDGYYTEDGQYIEED
ncbi:MAG: hypothetical protein ACXACY_19260 [Candidatus Hodarchaeales archaeon]|jgi:hypothetical protein